MSQMKKGQRSSKGNERLLMMKIDLFLLKTLIFFHHIFLDTVASLKNQLDLFGYASCGSKTPQPTVAGWGHKVVHN